MIRLFSHYVSGKLMLLVSLDLLVLVLSAYLGISVQLFGASGAASSIGGSSVPPQAGIFAFGVLLVMSSTGMYQIDIWEDVQSILGRLVAAVLLGAIAMIAISYFVPAREILPSVNLGPKAIVVTVLLALGGSLFVRFAFYNWVNLRALKPRVLVLGTGSRVMKLAESSRRNMHHVIVGYLATEPTRHFVPASQVIPTVPGESLLAVAKRYRVDQIVIGIRERRGGRLPVQELLACKLNGIRITELTTFFEREHRQVLLESLNPSWMVLEEGFNQGFFRSAVKRLFDLVVSGILLLLTLPLLIVTAVCIVIESGFPIFYRQERCGQDGKPFTLYKLRSMRNDAESGGTPRWAAANDDRTTRVGRIIRKLRIDELPQIINVMKGEMSFVGPRPERPFFVEQLEKQIPYYGLRHCAKPGITGWAQVCYPYGASLDDAVEKLQYDLYYVKNNRLFLDLMILIATVEVVLWGKGAR
jgi:sugar transferase (PEP-CTERM system associated)